MLQPALAQLLRHSVVGVRAAALGACIALRARQVLMCTCACAGKAGGDLDAQVLQAVLEAATRDPMLPPARFVALLYDFAGLAHCERATDCLLAYSL